MSKAFWKPKNTPQSNFPESQLCLFFLLFLLKHDQLSFGFESQIVSQREYCLLREILIPSRHTTSNPRRFDVDITSIRRRLNFDEFLRHFRVLFRCNFDGRKMDVVSTYFFRCNFDGQKIHVVSTYSFQCNFAGPKIHVVSTYIFRCNFAGRKIHVASTQFFSM